MLHPPISRNKRLNRIPAVIAGLMGFIPLWFAYDMSGFLQPKEHYLIYWALGIAACFFTGAIYLWRKRPRLGASIEFDENGFELFVRSRLRGEKYFEIAWHDLKEVNIVRAGYGVRSFSFVLTHDAALRLGLVRETTRSNAKLVGRSVGVPAAYFELQIADVVDRLRAAAEDAGYRFEKSKSKFYLLVTIERWVISQI